MNIVYDLYGHLKGDKAIWLIVALLGIFSILAVYSAAGSEMFKNYDGNTEYALIKQSIFLACGFVIMYVTYNLHYMQFSRLAPVLIALTIPLLIYTVGFTDAQNEARRWIQIPWIDKTFQTSDLAKLAIIVYIARILSLRQDKIKNFKSAFLPVIIPIVLITLLIAPADLSTAALLFGTCLLMMFIGRVSMKYISALILVGLIGFVFVLIIGKSFPDYVRVDTWDTRWTQFVTGDGYQVEQSKIAIASGGWFGVGPGNSFQRNYLPYPYADFIYSIICEEYGLMGAFTILGLYLLLLVRCIGIVTRCPKAFGAILAIGLCLNIVIQAFANIAVSVHLIPVTGLTFLLVSMGGTSILFTCVSLGIILSVSRYVDEAQKRKIELSEIEVRDAHNI